MEEAAGQLKQIVSVVWRWKWFIVLVTMGFAAGAYIHFSREEPIYRATARLRVRPSTIRVGEAQLEESPLRYLRAREFVNTIARSIKSPRILGKVFNNLGLQKIYKDSGDPLADFIKSFHAEPEIDSYLVNLWWESTDPKLAADVVNAVVSEVEQDEAERCQLISESAKRKLKTMLEEREKRLREAESRLREFEEQHAVASYESELKRLAKQVAIYEEAVTKLKLTLVDLQSKWETVERCNNDLNRLLTIPEIAEDSLVSFYRQKIENLKEERTKKLTTYAPTSREVRSVEQRLKELQNALKNAVRQKAEAIRVELERARKQMQQKQKLLEEARRKEREFARLLNQHEHLAAQLQTAQQLYMQALRRNEQLKTGGYSVLRRFEVDHRALVPRVPVWPKTFQFTAIAGVVGLLLALGLAFLFEHLDDSVRDEKVIEKVGAKFLGSVPRLRRGKELAVVDDPRSGAAEAFRALRLTLFAEIGDGNKILVSSPGAQEGKTVCAANLAAAIANWGKTVNLLDADLRHPRIHRILNMDSKTGLSEFLTSDDSSDVAFLQTRVPRLNVLPAGRPLANPADLLSSQKMADLIAEASKSGTLVMDSPPLLGPADTFVLARYCDAVVLVARAGKTKVGSLQRAVAHLKALGIEKVFVVLNRTTPATSRYYYYRYYHYYGKETG